MFVTRMPCAAKMRRTSDLMPELEFQLAGENNEVGVVIGRMPKRKVSHF